MTTDIFCFYLENRLIQTIQTGGQQYSDTSPFSIPCSGHYLVSFVAKSKKHNYKNQIEYTQQLKNTTLHY
jgi:hypothetical protein